MTAKEAIINRLKEAPGPLSLFELKIMGVSENAAATRLSELAREGRVRGTYRKDCAYKEWSLVEKVEFREESSGQMVAFG